MKLVEINPLNWCLLITIILLDIVRHDLVSHKNFESKLFIAHAIFNVLLVTFLSVKIHRVYSETYYDTGDPNTFRHELARAEQETKITRSSTDSRMEADPTFEHQRVSADGIPGATLNCPRISSDVVPGRRLMDRAERPSMSDRQRRNTDGYCSASATCL